jgi:hypothetical protein
LYFNQCQEEFSVIKYVPRAVELSLAVAMLCGCASMPKNGCDQTLPETTPTANFDINWTYGIAFDRKTKLTWKLCAEGQSYRDGYCSGNGTEIAWDDAMRTFGDSGTGWRLPNIGELKGIVESRCESPAINTSVFHNAPPAPFWSSTLNETDAGRARYVDFFSGDSRSAGILNKHMVRLVRGEDAKVIEERQELLQELLAQTTTDALIEQEKMAAQRANVTCRNKAHCDKLFSLTLSYIVSETGKPIERASKSLIKSADPSDVGDIGMTATLSPGEGNTGNISLSVSCKAFGSDVIIDNLKSEIEPWEKLKMKMKKSKAACLSKKLSVYTDFRSFVDEN